VGAALRTRGRFGLVVVLARGPLRYTMTIAAAG
jgi:hypothetical protein